MKKRFILKEIKTNINKAYYVTLTKRDMDKLEIDSENPYDWYVIIQKGEVKVDESE